jgi:plastocyanin
MRVRSWLLAAAASAALGVASLSFGGDLTGMCKLDGAAPEQKPIDMSGVPDCNNLHPDPINEENVVADKGMLANVVVAVKKEDSPDLTGDVPKDPAVIDQTGCQYKPHVLAMMTGQKFVIKNSDTFLHNIHTLSEKNPGFNKGQPQKNDGEEVDALKIPEYFHVKCDVHPWMSMYVAVFDHPFFGVSGADGKFTIKNLPDGDYTLVATHEKLGSQEAKVSFKGGKPAADVVFTFKPEAAMAPAAKEVIFASSSGEKETPACCAVPSKAAAVVGK